MEVTKLKKQELKLGAHEAQWMTLRKENKQRAVKADLTGPMGGYVKHLGLSKLTGQSQRERKKKWKEISEETLWL